MTIKLCIMNSIWIWKQKQYTIFCVPYDVNYLLSILSRNYFYVTICILIRYFGVVVCLVKHRYYLPFGMRLKPTTEPTSQNAENIYTYMYIVYIIWTNQCTYWNMEKKIRLNRNFIQRKQSAWTSTADERYEKGSNWNLHIITSQVMITQITPFTWFCWCF